MPDAGPSMMRRRVVLPAVIALGSNQGDREHYLREAVRAIDTLDGVRVTAASGIVESAALKLTGVDESAPSYLNAVVTADSALDPEGLLAALHEIEARFGRVRTEVWGDRTLDLDLIDFGGLRRHNETITLPHPRAGERAFVLAPWLQVNPDAVLVAPAPARRVADLLAAATDTVTDYPAEPLMAALDRTAGR
jgi:2-amino-4-hydroxy-6-hydroxymethyldihydropteridine diphosphokinase